MNPARLLLPTAASGLRSRARQSGRILCSVSGMACAFAWGRGGRAQRLQELMIYSAKRNRRNCLGCLMTKHLSPVHFACMVTAKGVTERKLMIAGPGRLPNGGCPSAEELINQPAQKMKIDEGTGSSHSGPVLHVDLHMLFLVFPIKYTERRHGERPMSVAFFRGALPRDSAWGRLGSNSTLPFAGFLQQDT